MGVSIARIPAIKSFETSDNFTAAYVPTAMWSDIELEVGIICACLPSLRALVIPLFTKRSDATATKAGVMGRHDDGNPYQTIGSNDAWRSRIKGKMGIADLTLNSHMDSSEDSGERIKSVSLLPLYPPGSVQMKPIA